jgi:sugar/nucleoside kinase (ribokinase family)
VDDARVQNACGAGDAAVAGFLSALLEGETLERAGRLAATAGRDSLYGTDTLGGLRDWTTMVATLEEGGDE